MAIIHSLSTMLKTPEGLFTKPVRLEPQLVGSSCSGDFSEQLKLPAYIITSLTFLQQNTYPLEFKNDKKVGGMKTW